MKSLVLTTQEFFSGRFTELTPKYCEGYGWHESDFEGHVYEAKRFGASFYLIPTKCGQVVSYRELYGKLICIDWCKPSELFPELRAALPISK